MKTMAILLLTAAMLPLAHRGLGGGGSPARPLLEERRTFYPGGRPYELRHFFNGREEGLQQVWTEDGQLYINYEMRQGRRYGFINARPCSPVKEGS